MSLTAADVERMSAIRKRAMKDYRPCSKCGSEQVQLVDYSAEYSRWKCRSCKNGWIWEEAK